VISLECEVRHTPGSGWCPAISLPVTERFVQKKMICVGAKTSTLTERIGHEKGRASESLAVSPSESAQ
jgi:hypothetical protein